MSHKHLNAHNLKIKHSMKLASDLLGFDSDYFHDRFINHEDIEVTNAFWKTLWTEYPKLKRYDRIYFCRSCQKFDLDYS